MANFMSPSRKIVFLPTNMVLFLRRRAMEVTGLALLFVGLALAGSLLSYSPTDASFNMASDRPPTNWLGMYGAVVADLSLQWVGLASIMPILATISWSWRLVAHRALKRFWMNFLSLILLIIFVSSFLGGLAPLSQWTLSFGLGGAAGDFFYSGCVGVMTMLPLRIPTWAVTLSLAVLSILALLMTLGMDLSEWRAIGRIFMKGVGAVHLSGKATKYFVRTVGTKAVRYGLDRREPMLGINSETGVQNNERVEQPLSIPLGSTSDGSTDIETTSRIKVSDHKLRQSRRAKLEEQPALDLLADGDYQLPAMHLLFNGETKQRFKAINEDALEQNARLLEKVLDDYGVRGKIKNVRPGPVVTLYELEPAPGTKTSRVIGLADDIARSMSARSVRIAVVPGLNAIGIELPNQDRETVFLRDLLSTPDYERSSFPLALALGKDIGGSPVMADLARMPHLLIAGTTGSGKSVAINTMILSLLYRLSPAQCRLIMIDPKMLELSIYDNIPHLLTPVVTDPAKAIMALKWAVREMENRYRSMASLGVRNITGYNQRLELASKTGDTLKRTVQTGFDSVTGEPVFEEQQFDMQPMPYIVVIVDEMADLMMVAGKDIEGAIQRLAQMARAAGIHLIMATQRPSVDVITGTIKANFPTRISFQVTSKIDSRTILGEQGAEQLLGQGDMLYMFGGGRMTRIHGPFVSDTEVEYVASAIRRQGQPEYLHSVTEDLGASVENSFGVDLVSLDGVDDLYNRAVQIVSRHQKASTSFLQRQLKIGYNRAADLVDRMEAEGVIGPANHVGKREVLIPEPVEEI